jgi:O-methyltransferase involved in polyketide biosynthesis
VTWTLLGTLYLRAYESRSERSILRDHYSAEAIAQIDYDFARLEKRVRPQGNQFLVALRAKQLDDWAADFLARHLDATVLHLGCGLDSRMLRLAPLPAVRWFDVDVPTVIELRRRFYPERDHYRMLGASVTDPGWLEQVPADRPVLIIAEGLLMYLEERDVRQLLQLLTDRFGSGELLVDVLAPWLARLSGPFRWGIWDPRQIERWNPRLHLVARVRFATHFAWIPDRGYRVLFQVMNGFPGLRSTYQELRYTF